MSLFSANSCAKVLAIGIVFVSTVVTPWNNLDPVSVPKLFIISVIASFAIFCKVLNPKSFLEEKSIFHRLAKLGIFLVIVTLIINFQFPSERIFGVNGRNVGAIFFVSIFAIMLIANQAFELKHSKLLIVSMKISGILVASYFVIQKFGLDKAQWIDVYGGVPSSTLGNPNFVSALVAMSFSSTLPFLFNFKGKRRHTLIIALFSILELFVIIESNSEQGIVISGIGLFVVLYVKVLNWISRHRTRVNGISLVTLTLMFSAFVLFLLESRVSLSSNATVLARLDYWRAAVAMIFHSPIYGQGFDYFGEVYFRFRSPSAAERSPGLFTDSAHNYFLDLGAFSGLLMLLCFLIPIFIVFSQTFQKIFFVKSKQDKFEAPSNILLGLIIAWYGFVFQALINPISHALFYLGVVITSCLHSIFNAGKARLIQTGPIMSNQKSVIAKKGNLIQSTSRFLLIRILFVVIGGISASSILLGGAQPMIADARFRDAIEQGNGDGVLNIALSQPKSFARMEIATQLFLANNRQDLALKVARIMVKDNPGNIRGWRKLLAISNEETEKELARQKLLELDPNNPELLAELTKSRQ